MTAYQVFEALHVFAAVLLIGNLVVTALWKAALDRGADPARARLVSETVLRADWAFTLPGAVIVLVTGVILTVMGAYDIREEWWLMFGMVFFISMLALWIFYLLPKQRELLEIARRGEASGKLDPAYERASRAWSLAGGFATFLPVAALFLMVLKPF